MIADTTFMVDLLRGNNKAAAEKARAIEDSKETVFLTSITVFELWQGAVTAADKRESHKVVDLVGRMPILPFEENAAKEAGIISGELLKSGLAMEPEDCMIAGIARARNQKLITRNVKHFSRVKELDLETY